MRNALKLAHSVFHPQAIKNISQNATPILIFHCILGCRKSWDYLAQRIADETQQRVYSLDMCNHGESPSSYETSFLDMAKDVYHFVDSREIRRCDVIGHSMGGRVAMVMALEKPPLVRTMTSIDVSPLQEPVQMPASVDYWITTLRNIIAELPKGITLKEAKDIAEKKMTEKEIHSEFRPVLLDTLIQKGESFEWMSNLDIIQEKFDPFILKFPKLNHLKYTGPACIIGSGVPAFLKLKDHLGIYKLFPKAEISYIPESSHQLPTDKPQELLDKFMVFHRRFSYLP